eukprot:m51a1_g2467 putative staphylococcal nuclease domain-containing protein 1 (941) ;mRNA; f:32476-35975
MTDAAPVVPAPIAAASSIEEPATQPIAAPPSSAPHQQQRHGYRGQVKAVPSGDTLVVSVFAPDGTSADHTVSLSGIVAPRLGRLQGEVSGGQSSEDEAFAWDSREFLRRKCIGQMVSCTVVGAGPKREFVTAQLNGEDLTKQIVAEGWAHVRAPNVPANGTPRPEVVALLELEEQAKQQKKGIHNLSSAASSKRPLHVAITPLSFFDREKDREVKAIVEVVRTGTMFRVTFLPSFLSATLNVAGCAAPNVRWNPEKKELEAEPFGMEARHFIEHHVLNREISVKLRSIDKSNFFTGVVTVLGRDLAQELIKIGMAKFVQWAGVKDDAEYCQKLKQLEDIAVEKRAGVWVNGRPSVAADAAREATATTFKGKVIDIPTSGILEVLTENGVTRRVTLASIRVPRVIRETTGPRKDAKKPTDEKKPNATEMRRAQYESAMGLEGREVLRKKLIGNLVECVQRYEREPQEGDTQHANEGPRAYSDVYFQGANIALLLLNAGLATVVPHRSNEPRSDDYDALCMSEKRAQAKPVGLFVPPNKMEIPRVTDYTVDQDQARCAGLLASLRGKDIDAVVEHIWTATHVKVFVRQINSYISLCLVAVRIPRAGERGVPKGIDKSALKYDTEAIRFVKESCQLRNVKINIENVDRRGNFIGSLHLDAKRDLGHLLVVNGYAYVSEMDDRSPSYAALAEIQEQARGRRVKIWEGYAPPVIELPYSSDRPKEHLEVVVTEVFSVNEFYVQNVKEAVALEELSAKLAQLAASPEQQQLARQMDIKRGFIVLAKFAEDNCWYRARVTQLNGDDLVVQFIDFGNKDKVDRKFVMPLPQELQKLPPFAKKSGLAFITVPADEDMQQSATQEFMTIVGGKRLQAVVEGVDDGLQLSLALNDSHINTALVRDGFARVLTKSKVRADEVLLANLKDAEGKARANRMNMWQYGDYCSDED